MRAQLDPAPRQQVRTRAIAVTMVVLVFFVVHQQAEDHLLQPGRVT
jgi:hypothetical protein